jgi:tRNA (cmo5U34)-methyltransferase
VETGHQRASHDHGHGHGQQEHGQAGAGNALSGHTHDDQWHDEEYVKQWVERQKGRQTERRRQFVALRAFITKGADQEFRYLNLGAGPGNLDTILLEHFKGANAVVLDGSLAMLAEARKELARFGDRVEYVQGDLSNPDWTGAVGGPFDYVISSRTIHHLSEPKRIRALYREILALTGHGGTFLNLDYMRPSKADLARLGEWIARDAEAGFAGAPHSAADMPGTLIEHLGWLGEAGFGTVEVYWKEMDLALLGGINGHLHMPWGHGDDPSKGESQGHGHGHGH